MDDKFSNTYVSMKLLSLKNGYVLFRLGKVLGLSLLRKLSL